MTDRQGGLDDARAAAPTAAGSAY